ncbi:hypothetical protein V8C86DRAFT_2632450, partial [Haematococcus lacustris]
LQRGHQGQGQGPLPWEERGGGAASRGDPDAAPPSIADRMVITATVPWPLNLVLHAGPAVENAHRTAGCGLDPVDSGMALYADIASSLLRLRLCLAALNRAWMHLGKPVAGAGSKSATNQHRRGLRLPATTGAAPSLPVSAEERLDRRLRAVRGWLAAVLHFVAAVQRAAQGALLGRCAAWLQAQLVLCGPRDVPHMRLVHTEYLMRAAATCYVAHGRSGENPELRNAVVAALRCCEAFTVVVGQFAELAAAAPAVQVEPVRPGSSRAAELYQLLQTRYSAFASAALKAFGVMKALAYGSMPTSHVLTGSGSVGSSHQQIATELLAQLDCDWYEQHWAQAKMRAGKPC